MGGLLSSKLEIKYYINIRKPDVFCMTVTNLKEKIDKFQQGGYKIWRRDRKGKGGRGVLLIVQEDISGEKVQYGDGMAEVIGITIQTNGREGEKL